MKILLIDPEANSQTSRKYIYYSGLLSGINSFLKSKKQDSLEKVEFYFSSNFVNKIDNSSLKFDYVIFGLGWFGSTNYFGKFECEGAKKIVFIFKPQNDIQNKLNFCKNNSVDAILTPIPFYKKYQKKTGIKTFLFPYGYFPEIFKPRPEIEKKYDVGFSGALHQNKFYPEGSFPSQNLRLKIKDKLESMNNINVFWKSSDVYETARIHDHEEYAKTINSSKIWIATNASHGDVTPRYYEILASGTLLFCEDIREEYKHILIDGFNCVSFKSDLSDFDLKLEFYIKNNEKREEIIKNAIRMSIENTWEARARQLIELISEDKNE